jgi:cytochrome P450
MLSTPLQTMNVSPLRQLRSLMQPLSMYGWLKENAEDLALLRILGRDYVGILTPEGIRQVFAADPAGYDVFWKDSFAGLHGDGSLFVLVGDRHRKERQLLMPAFHANHFRTYGEAIRDITRQKTEKWRPGRTIKTTDTTLSISLDVIMRVVFGVVDAQLMQDGRRFVSALLKTVHPLLVFMPALQRPWFPLWREHIRAKAQFSDWFNRYLDWRRARTEESDDVLGRMLAAHYEDGSQMSNADIQDELVTILLAGHNTTATAMAWALYELGRHPVDLERLRAELATLGPDPDPALTVKLPYLSAVCNETLRLHTVLAEIGRVLTAPLTLFGHTIQPGVSVMISVIGIHHDPVLYPEPYAFLPQRFIEHTYGPCEFLPFGGGHRRCLGANLSEYEMRIALAEIVTHWNFEPTEIEHEIRQDIALGPKNGVRLRIEGRRTPPEVLNQISNQISNRTQPGAGRV